MSRTGEHLFGGPDARQECPCSDHEDGFDPECDVHGDAELVRIYWEDYAG